MKRPVLPTNQISFFNLSVEEPSEMATVSTPVAAPVLAPVYIVPRDKHPEVIVPEITVLDSASIDTHIKARRAKWNKVQKEIASGVEVAVEGVEVTPADRPEVRADQSITESQIPEGLVLGLDGTDQLDAVDDDGTLQSEDFESSSTIVDHQTTVEGPGDIDGRGLGEGSQLVEQVASPASTAVEFPDPFASMFVTESMLDTFTPVTDLRNAEYDNGVLQVVFEATADPLVETVVIEEDPDVEENILVPKETVIDVSPMAAALRELLANDMLAAQVLEAEIAASAPEAFVPVELEFETFVADNASTEELDSLDDVVVSPSVTFHKHGKLLAVKANDHVAADLWREISSRLKNKSMINLTYFNAAANSITIPERKHCLELWRWVEDGLESHPYFTVLQTYGVTAHISPSLAGYMQREKKRVAIRSTPYPCYESSPDDITETIVPGMILKCKEKFDGGSYQQIFRELDRYMVKGLTETGEVEVYSTAIQGRKALSEDSAILSFTKDQIQQYFEDSDKFVVTENVNEKFPILVGNLNAQLDKLVIGEEGRLFDHSRQDVGGEVLKGDFMCSKSMRMGKSREVIAACELIGSKKRAWIGPAMATIDTPYEFGQAGVSNFKEIVSILDLENPASYHIMTMDFLKKNSDPMRRVRRGNKDKTWLRKMGEGRSLCDCPHCDQPLERPIKVRAVDGRIIHVSWTLYNGYACRNPYCIWTEINNGRNPSRKSGKQKVAPTPWHRAGDVKAITHQGGYTDYERKQHAGCGDHVGRKRICPKCGLVDSSWVPAIYKRIKKRYGTVVIDELHLTKEGGSSTSKACLDMRGKHHIGATGTPMSNSLVDMFEQFVWLFHTKSAYFPYDRKTGKSEFKERFCENIKITRVGTDRSHYKTLPYARNPLDFWNFVAPLLVRRTRADKVYLASLEKLNLKVPSEQTFVMPVRMIPPQALLLSASIESFKEDFEDYCMELEEQGKSLNSHIVMTMMSRMKTAATIPGFLNKPDMPILYDGGELDPYGIGGKGVALSAMVPAKISEGKKVVIMSQFVMMREKLVQKFAHLNPVVMPSGTVAKKRESLNLFRTGTERPLMIVGPKQVCLGVELNCADVLIVPDLMWEAGTQQQALMRLMGPAAYERWVEMYILNSEHSIDEHIYNVFYGKIAGMEQALDKRVVTRSAQSVNWVAFADTVVAQQASLQSYFRDDSNEEEGIAMPDFSNPYFDDDERVA